MRRRRLPHRCYEAAGQWFTESDVVYTEGRALSGVTNHWVPHAWLTDVDGRAIDLAWAEPGAAYVGIQLDDRQVLRALGHLGYYGPLMPVLLQWGVLG